MAFRQARSFSDTAHMGRPLWLLARFGKLALRWRPSHALPPELSAALRAQTRDDRRAHARRGLERMAGEERGLDDGTSRDEDSVWSRLRLLDSHMHLALLAEDYDATKRYAERCLTIVADVRASDPAAFQGALSDMTYRSHHAIGHAAFETGDADAAEVHLLESVRVDPAPVTLRSFGPSMSLARRLMQSGRSEAVILYLRACQAFWNRKLLERWIAEIESGTQPTLRTPGDSSHE